MLIRTDFDHSHCQSPNSMLNPPGSENTPDPVSVAAADNKQAVLRWRVWVHGLVQGVGFRPFVYLLASQYQLSGFVRNQSAAVVIEVQGPGTELDQFLKDLRNNAPPLSQIEEVLVEERCPQPDVSAGQQVDAIAPATFVIEDSDFVTEDHDSVTEDHDSVTEDRDLVIEDRDAPDNPRDLKPASGDMHKRYTAASDQTDCQPASPKSQVRQRIPAMQRSRVTLPSIATMPPIAVLPPDTAMCEDCRKELTSPTNRRFGYPFINCTQCGPRFTIIRDMPYDRRRTTMSAFDMCDACRREYNDPTDRRFHAEPIACPCCGPQIWLATSTAQQEQHRAQDQHGPQEPGDAIASVCDPPCRSDHSDSAGQVVRAFHRLIRDGKIVAVKGIGGFHLVCSATDDQAIARLRQRKHRSDKPLAVMVSSLHEAEQLAVIDQTEASLLTSRQRPIVLLVKRPSANVSDLLAPSNHRLGVMLPYSPLHHLLSAVGPLVMTSGNAVNEPICCSNQEAVQRLSAMADAFLLHDRAIHSICDDSVIQAFRGRELFIRRSRGYAPWSGALPAAVSGIVATGAELKAALCLTQGPRVLLSQHIGDMTTMESLQAFNRAADNMLRLLRLQPSAVACDLHPDYVSTRWAESFAARHTLPLFRIQHHHAHVAAVLAEHNLPADINAIGIAYDGTGYGDDSAIWGSEIMIVSCRSYRRAAHLRYIPLPGGDLCMRQIYRTALAHLWSADLPWDPLLPCVATCSKTQLAMLRKQLERNINCPLTSSMGRLFDAVAAIIGLRQSVTFEAQAAIQLESLCGPVDAADFYPIDLDQDPISGCLKLDPGRMLRQICEDYRNHQPLPTIVARFFGGIVDATVRACVEIRRIHGLNLVVISGGVFQNVIVLEHLLHCLEDQGFDARFHRQVPPNDGGLALGQAAIASAWLQTATKQ